MRILLVCEAFQALGGLREAVDSLACEFLRASHSVAVASVYAPYRNDRIVRAKVDCFPIKLPRWKPVTWRHPERFFRRPNPAELKSVISDWRADVVNLHGGVWERFPMVIAACRAAGASAVITFQSASYAGTWGVQALGSLKDAAALTAVSEGAKGYLQDLSPPMRTARVIPNGVDCELLRAATPFHRARPYIFCAARLYLQEKAVDVLVRGFSLIAREHPEVDLLIAGDGPDRPVIERLAAECGLGGRVELLGFKSQEELSSLYKGALLFAMPSRFREGLPLVFLEAMAAGLPSIGTRIGGVPEVVLEGRTGLLIEENVPEELARHLRTLLDSADTRERMSRSALEVAIQYDWPGIAARYLEVYAKAAPGR